MWKLTARGIASKKARFVLTAFAIALGVAFMAGTLVLTDTIRKSSATITTKANEGTDAYVRAATAFEDDDGFEQRGTVPAADLDTVLGVDGVATAGAVIEGPAQIIGRDGELLDANDNGWPRIGMAWLADERLNPLELADGTAPDATDEVVIDETSADTGDFTVGDDVAVTTAAVTDTYTISGIATYGGAEDAGGSSVVAFVPETAATVIGSPGLFDGIRVAADDGVSQQELATRIEAALADPSLETITGAELVESQKEEGEEALSFLNIFLMTFAVVALLVGSFVIFNTFSITVAQRTRETAMLRAIGAGRRQILGSVLLESFVTGVVASAIGVGLGLLTATGLTALLSGFGLSLPEGALVVLPRTVIVSMVLGTAVTLLAAFAPARRSARIAPIAALRDVAMEPVRTSRTRTVTGLAVTAAGAACLGLGLFGDAGIAMVGLGAAIVFLGVAVLGPVIARPLASLLGAPLALRGMTGKLARENARRNPRRTSATASALMIGAGLVAFVTIFAASAKTSLANTVDEQMAGDYIVEATVWDAGLSPDLVAELGAVPGVEAATPITDAQIQVDGSTKFASAIDPATFAAGVDVGVARGDFAALGTNGIAVADDVATDHDWQLGDTVDVSFVETGTHPFTIVATYDHTDAVGNYVISADALHANSSETAISWMVVDTDGSAGVQDALDAVLVDHPNADLMTAEEFKQSMADELDSLLNLVYVLLALAIVIALFGIANTLALSILERRRELGLLRAVGMSRRQLKSAIRWESVIIALLGTVLGVAIGIGFGWGAVSAMESEGIDTLVLPGGPLVVIAGLAALAGVGAAALPARRASRLDILPALQSD